MRRLCLLLAILGALLGAPAATAAPELPAAGPLAEGPPPAPPFNLVSPIRSFKLELLG